MVEFITTFGGTHFYPLKPSREDLYIEDIAHALSLLCRGNGHVKQFFSVGQHCVHCALEAEARGYSQRVQLACLLHDAAEAYLSDVPTPFKRQMAEYYTWEDRILDMVYDKFIGSPLSEEEQALVKKVDEDMLYFDLTILLNEQLEKAAPHMESVFSYEVLPFETVEQKYLSLYHRLKSQ